MRISSHYVQAYPLRKWPVNSYWPAHSDGKEHRVQRGNVFVVRTSKPVENLWKNGLFWSPYSFVTHSIDRKPRDRGLARSAYSIKYRKTLSVFLLDTSCLGRLSGDGLRAPFGRRAVRQRGYGLRLLIFKMANNKVDLGQIKSEEIFYSRFIKIPLG